MAITHEAIAHIESLALAASKGPWTVDALDVGARFNIDTQCGTTAIAIAQDIPGDVRNTQRKANADFIAATNPEIVLELIRILRESQLVCGAPQQ